MKKAEKKIKEITKKIVKKVDPEKIILFGSFAWGKPGPDSDIDLFVIEKSDLPKRERQIKIRRLFLDFDMPADVLSYTNNEIKKRLDINDYFIENIINNGKILYERK